MSMKGAKKKQLVVIGGGPAGLAAALAAKRSGISDILILERDEQLGGILNQCIHNGFGLHTFHEELTGPEYASRYIKQIEQEKIDHLLDTMVIDLDHEKNITFVNQNGVQTIQAQAIILAMGCRERPRGALNIPGYRPAGIYCAGTAQKLVNIDGFMPGNDVVILGSGDIGLIMARRMRLEGANVHAVVEIMPYSGGLKRNIVQCLDDFDIPLKLGHTITNIEGKERVKKVTIAKVDENRRPIRGTEETIECDTLLLSCGLIPENELSEKAGIQMHDITHGPLVDESLQTSVEGIFACGNVLHVHDLVDFVSREAELAGIKAARYILNTLPKKEAEIVIETKGIVRYCVPAMIDPKRMDDLQVIRFRVNSVLKDGSINVWVDDRRVLHQQKKIMTPGEMEQVILKKKDLAHAKTICIESEER